MTKNIEINVCTVTMSQGPNMPNLTCIRVSFLWDIGKQNILRFYAAKRGVPSGAILFADRNFEK